MSVDELMQWAQQTVGEHPYLLLWAGREEDGNEPFPDPGAVARLLTELPPAREDGDWSLHKFLDLREAAPTSTGLLWKGRDLPVWFRLLHSGALGALIDLLHPDLQWQRPAELGPWLYPYALCDLCVSFAESTHALAREGLIPTPNRLVIHIGNANGLLLPGGHRDSPAFHRSVEEDRPRFQGNDLRVAVQWPDDADPVDAAEEAVRQVYRRFGHPDRMVPPRLFDEYRRV